MKLEMKPEDWRVLLVIAVAAILLGLFAKSFLVAIFFGVGGFAFLNRAEKMWLIAMSVSFGLATWVAFGSFWFAVALGMATHFVRFKVRPR